MIEFRIDRRAGIAPYRQLIQQVEQALRMGRLQPGDQLPTAKDVVAATAINPNTVLKAYRELERDGLVEAKQGVGTFVRRSLARPDNPDDDRIRADLREWVDRAKQAGFGRGDLEALMTAELDSRFADGDRKAR